MKTGIASRRRLGSVGATPTREVEARVERWLFENNEALKSSNDFIAAVGLPLRYLRGF